MNFFFSSRRRHTFFFQAEDGIRDRSPSRGLGDVYKRQASKVYEYKTGRLESFYIHILLLDFFKMTSLPRKIWEHPAPESTQMGHFQQDLEKSTGRKFDVSEDSPCKDYYIV